MENNKIETNTKVIWRSIIAVLLSFLVLWIFLSQKDFVYEIHSFEIDGVLIEQFEDVSGNKNLKLRKDNEYPIINLADFPPKLINFIQEGDSIYSASGDTLINVFRSDSTYIFQRFVDLKKGKTVLYK